MPISFDSERKIFKLDAGDTSYAFMIEKHNYLSHLYYGPELSTMDLEYLYRPTVRGFAPYPEGMQPEASRDVTAQEYSAFGTGDYRTPGFIIRVIRLRIPIMFRIKFTRANPASPDFRRPLAGKLKHRRWRYC